MKLLYLALSNVKPLSTAQTIWGRIRDVCNEKNKQFIIHLVKARTEKLCMYSTPTSGFTCILSIASLLMSDNL